LTAWQMATDPLRHCAEYETIRRHIAVPSDSGLSEKMEKTHLRERHQRVP